MVNGKRSHKSQDTGQDKGSQAAERQGTGCRGVRIQAAEGSGYRLLQKGQHTCHGGIR